MIFPSIGHFKTAPTLFFEEVAASDTAEVLVAADPAGRRILLLQLFAVSDDATDITLGSAGVAISPPIPHNAGAAVAAGEVLPFSPVGWAVTAAGEALTVTTSAGGNTGFMGAYVLV